MNEWDVIRIPVWKYGQIAGYAIVDAADAHHAEYRWRLTDGYAVRGYSPNVIRLHREVLGLIKDDGMEADHINRDTLDNRRSNLRAVTHAQNVQNVGANQGVDVQPSGRFPHPRSVARPGSSERHHPPPRLLR
jgi:hypothetical protein